VSPMNSKVETSLARWALRDEVLVSLDTVSPNSLEQLLRFDDPRIVGAENGLKRIDCLSKKSSSVGDASGIEKALSVRHERFGVDVADQDRVHC
jgi:hypothetical protein